MKYKLTNPVKFKGRILYRVQALKGFNDVKKSDLGGCIESEKNLSQNGICWVYDDVIVTDNAIIKDNAKIENRAIVKDNAVIKDNACVEDNAIIQDYAIISSHTEIGGHDEISGLTFIPQITN